MARGKKPETATPEHSGDVTPQIAAEPTSAYKVNLRFGETGMLQVLLDREGTDEDIRQFFRDVAVHGYVRSFANGDIEHFSPEKYFGGNAKKQDASS